MNPSSNPPASLRLDISPGRMLLIVGPRAIRFYMTRLVVSLARTRPVRVLDAGGQLEPSLLHQLAGKRKQEILARLDLTPVRSGRHLEGLLESAGVRPIPLILLDLLGPFSDTSLSLPERRQVLQACLEQLQRLKVIGGAVSLCPPVRPLVSARLLFRLVEQRAPIVFTARLTLPSPELKKLYGKSNNS